MNETKNTQPQIFLKSVDEKVWDNIWYPLSGPPKNDAERKVLEDHVKQEKAMVQSALHSFKVSNEDLEMAARSNCVELELDWQYCLRSLSFDRFYRKCPRQHEKFQSCVNIQKVSTVDNQGISCRAWLQSRS
jgi:hypothetical protein